MTPKKIVLDKNTSFANFFEYLGIPGLDAEDFQFMQGLQLTKEVGQSPTLDVRFRRGNPGQEFTTFRRYTLIIQNNVSSWERVD